MHSHEFLMKHPTGYEYNLIFRKYTPMPVFLPAPTLFDLQTRQRYYILEDEVREHNATVEAARLAAEAACLVEEEARNASMSYHFNYYSDH